MPVYDETRMEFDGISRGVPERAAIITCLNDDHSVYRVKYENDTLSPFYGTDGSRPTIACSTVTDYWLSDEGRAAYDQKVAQHFAKKQ